MEEFKKVFEKMAMKYVEFVDKRVEKANEKAATNDRTAMLLMNEVRSANVVAVTLTRLENNNSED